MFLFPYIHLVIGACQNFLRSRIAGAKRACEAKRETHIRTLQSSEKRCHRERVYTEYTNNWFLFNYYIYIYIYISIFWSFWYTSACLYRLNHVPMISGHIGRTYTTAWKSSTWSQGRKDPGSRRKAMKKSKDPIPNLRPSSPFHKCPTVSIKYSWYVLHCDLAWPVRTGVWGPVHPCWCFWWPRRDGCPTYRRQVFVGRPKETPQSGGGG